MRRRETGSQLLGALRVEIVDTRNLVRLTPTEHCAVVYSAESVGGLFAFASSKQMMVGDSWARSNQAKLQRTMARNESSVKANGVVGNAGGIFSVQAGLHGVSVLQRREERERQKERQRQSSQSLARGS